MNCKIVKKLEELDETQRKNLQQWLRKENKRKALLERKALEQEVITKKGLGENPFGILTKITTKGEVQCQ